MRRPARLFPAILLLAGLSVLLYPALSNWLAARGHSRAITEYTLTVEALADREITEQLRAARRYNEQLTGTGIGDSFAPGEGAAAPVEYLSILDVGGMIGYLEIPAIDVLLPIYHTTTEQVLRKGVGHLHTSAFPVGGDGTHAVLTAHRGLPSARLFTDLTELAPGDRFYVHVLDQVLGYEVEQIRVVEPHETGDLQPVSGMDFLTLVTCTPYAVNSHRLLVRGSRIPPAQEEPTTPPPAPTDAGRALWPALLGGLALCVAAGLILWAKRRASRYSDRT